MDVQELLAQARDSMTVSKVFGEPIERDGVVVIPVAKVVGGAGAGGGTSPAVPGAATSEGEVGAAAAGPESGFGAGYGLRATPAGVYVIRDGRVTWEPSVDTGMLAVQRTLVILIAILAARSIIKAIVGR